MSHGVCVCVLEHDMLNGDVGQHQGQKKEAMMACEGCLGAALECHLLVRLLDCIGVGAMLDSEGLVGIRRRWSHVEIP